MCARDAALLEQRARRGGGARARRAAGRWPSRPTSRSRADVERLVGRGARRVSAAARPREQRRRLRPDGLDRGRRLGRAGCRRSRSTCSARSCCAARCCRTSSAQRYGKIVQLSGGGATNPLPRISAYAASKAAVVRFAETLAEEVRDDGIDVNAIAPGRAQHAHARRGARGRARSGRRRRSTSASLKQKDEGGTPLETGAALACSSASAASDGITGKLLSAVWDPWEELPAHRDDLDATDVYTLRRIVPDGSRPDVGRQVSRGVAIVGCGLIGQQARAGARRRAAGRLRRRRSASAPRRWRATRPGARRHRRLARGRRPSRRRHRHRRDDQRRADAGDRVRARRGRQARAGREAGGAHRSPSSTR